MATNNNDMAAQIAALQATVADLQDQINWLFSRHGPARWPQIVAQRNAAMKQAGTKPVFNRGDFIYRPKPAEEQQ
jgi:hypothetical protein